MFNLEMYFIKNIIALYNEHDCIVWLLLHLIEVKQQPKPSKTANQQ